MRMLTCASVLLLLLVWMGPAHSQVPATARQLIVAVAPSWSSQKGTLYCWERKSPKDPWRPAFTSGWQVQLGKHGLAWGRGISAPANPDIPWKVEKDGKAPAGLFELGRLHGAAARAPQGALWPYLQVGRWDAWVDNPKLPHYNQHVRVDPANVPPWFESQRMRLGDSAYKWLLEIRHNSAPQAVPGYGSAIFFHVRRGPDRPTAGCTTMTVENLEKMIRWLRQEQRPHYVLLPQAEYTKLRAAWRLP